VADTSASGTTRTCRGGPESVYDVILLLGSSKESWERAAANAVEQASKSLRNLRVAEIVERT
jgi:dodecin